MVANTRIFPQRFNHVNNAIYSKNGIPPVKTRVFNSMAAVLVPQQSQIRVDQRNCIYLTRASSKNPTVVVRSPESTEKISKSSLDFNIDDTYQLLDTSSNYHAEEVVIQSRRRENLNHLTLDEKINRRKQKNRFVN